MSLSSVLFRAMGICAFMAAGLLQAQHLTISTGGQTGTSGTNWSITGNTLNVTASNVSAHIHPSVITNHLTSTGDLTIVLPWVSGIPRDLNINSSIAYTGSTARTLTFNIVNDIIAASGISITSSNTSLNLVLRTAMSTSNTDHGRIQLDGTTITTNGGHFWAGGGSGSSTWNSLTVGNTYSRTWADDVSGVSFLNASLTTSGGNIYMAGMSYNTSDADGENYGINIRNSSITSGAGQIDILGDLKGMYTTGSGLGIFGNSGTVTISSTTGAINLTGTGADQAGTNTGWRRGALLYTLASTGVSVTSTSGNITITGTAAFPTNGNDDMMGLQLGTTQSIADGIKISSQTGNIRLAGSNTREAAGQNSNAVQFIAANTSNSIRIGYNGTNAYSGNITVEGNSIIQNNVNAGSGSISVQSTGTLTIQPSGNAFTYLRSGASGSLTFDDDWAFGTTLSGFTFGKSTNNLAVSFSNDITLNGPFTAYGSNMGLNGIAANGNIYIRSTTYIDQNGAKTTSTNGGNLVYWAGGSGESYIRPGTITTNGGHVFMGGDFDAVGTRVWHGHTVGGGYAFSSSFDGIALRGNIDTRVTNNQSIGGDVYLAGESGNANGADVGAESTNRTISSGNGDLTFMPYSEQLQSVGTSWQMILQTTGKVSIAPVSGRSFWSGQTRTYNGTMSGSTFNGSSALVGIQIPNFASIGGLELGTWSGTGVNGDNAYTSSNIKNMTLEAAFTVAGPITMYGGNMNVNADLTSTASGAAILLKTSEFIPGANATDGFLFLGTNTDITSSGGNIILWTNTTNRTAAYGQANNEIVFVGTNSINSNGGKIVLAGGLDDGGNGGTASDGIPDGFAYRGSYSGEAIDIRANATLNSGGGEIIIRGEQNGSDDGIGTDATFTISNAGAVTLEGKNATNSFRSVRLGTANITSTLSNAPVSITGTTHLWGNGLVSITTAGGDVLLAGNTDDATDGESVINGYVQFRSGLSVTTNGGDITLGGGNATGTNYAMGTSDPALTEGIRIDVSANFNSNGGNIVMRGKSFATSVSAGVGASGLMFHALTSSGSINSGTGTILLDGFSQTSGASANANAGILFWNISANTFTIQSANTTSSAITLNGYATGTSGQAYGIEVETANTLNILATGAGGGININTGNNSNDPNDIVLRGPTNILASSGPISIKGKQFGGTAISRLLISADLFLGSKSGTAVTSSSADITLEFDNFNFNSLLPKIGTTGAVEVKPISTSFGAALLSSWFDWNQNSQTMSALTLGKPGNTANITHQTTAISVAGPIAIYGGDIAIYQNLRSTSSGAAILVQATGHIELSTNDTIRTNGGAVTLNATSGGTATTNIRAIYLYSGSGILSNGGNITLGGGYAGTEGNLYAATNVVGGGYAIVLVSSTLNAAGGHIRLYGRNVSSYGDGVFLNSVNISTTGSGTIGIFGDSYGGYNGTTYFGGITFENFASTIQTVNGNITLKGILTNSQSSQGYGINFYRSPGSAGNTRHIQILSQTGNIQITGDRGSSIGSGIGHSSWGDVYFGSPLNNSYTASGNITFTYSELVHAGSNGFKVKTTGAVTYEPTATNFDAAQTFPPTTNYVVADGATSLTLGKSGNTANVTLSSAQSIAGPISIYGGTLTFSDNLSSSAGGNISLYGNTLSFASGKTVSSTGELLVAPSSVSTTVGLAGATGTLQVTSTHLSTNFVNGFSNITIGSDAQTGNIASNAFTLQDNMTFKTTGTLSLGGNVTLGTNNATLGSSLSMGTGTNYFQTNSTGVLKRSVGNAGTFAFAVGNSAYNPVSITNNTGTADEFNLRVLDEVYKDGTSGTVLTTPRVKRTWLIGKTNANAGSGIDFVFNWNTGESTSGLNAPRLYHYDGTEWDKQTGTTSSTSSSLTYTGYTGTFSPFTIGDDVVLLPVSWLHFDCGKQTSNGTELNWSTASEENSSRFVVERSQNGQAFEPIGYIPAAGYSHSIRQYRFTDPNPLKTRAYYRIAVEENNGQRIYTSICMSNVSADAENSPVKVYPNPSQGVVNIHATEGGTYQISDMAGRLIRAGKLDGITQIEGLKSGVYSLTIQSGDDRYSQLMIVK